MEYAKGDIDNIMKMTPGKAVGHRLPWLLLGLGGGLIASSIISRFEATLSENLILASFIPLIVYMSDAVQTQSESFVIRDFALRSKTNFAKYFVRQFAVILSLALILALFVFLFVEFLMGETQLGVVISLALFFSILSTAITGLILPHFFETLKLDPANASGPVATIIQDILSIIIYFSIAGSLL